jgi:hypothetical protein
MLGSTFSTILTHFDQILGELAIVGRNFWAIAWPNYILAFCQCGAKFLATLPIFGEIIGDFTNFLAIFTTYWRKYCLENKVIIILRINSNV